MIHMDNAGGPAVKPTCCKMYDSIMGGLQHPHRFVALFMCLTCRALTYCLALCVSKAIHNEQDWHLWWKTNYWDWPLQLLLTRRIAILFPQKEMNNNFVNYIKENVDRDAGPVWLSGTIFTQQAKDKPDWVLAWSGMNLRIITLKGRKEHRWWCIHHGFKTMNRVNLSLKQRVPKWSHKIMTSHRKNLKLTGTMGNLLVYQHHPFPVLNIEVMSI